MIVALVDIATDYDGESPADNGCTRAALLRRLVIEPTPAALNKRPYKLTKRGAAHLLGAQYEYEHYMNEYDDAYLDARKRQTRRKKPAAKRAATTGRRRRA